MSDIFFKKEKNIIIKYGTAWKNLNSGGKNEIVWYYESRKWDT